MIDYEAEIERILDGPPSRLAFRALRDLVLPDPRSQPELRGVTHLDLGWYVHEQLAAVVETLEHWENLRSIEVLARLAGDLAVTRIESLNLVTARDDLWHFEIPPFLAECRELSRLERLAIGFRCGRNGRQPRWQPYFGNVIEQDDDACEAFFARDDLASLRDLTLELLPVGDETIARVLGAVDHDRIEKLTLADLVATDLTATAFVAAQAFPRLRHLDLSRNHLGADGAPSRATVLQTPNGKASAPSVTSAPNVPPGTPRSSRRRRTSPAA